MPKKTMPTMKLRVYVPQDVLEHNNELLRDPLFDRIPHGARSGLITHLLRAWNTLHASDAHKQIVARLQDAETIDRDLLIAALHFLANHGMKETRGVATKLLDLILRKNGGIMDPNLEETEQ